MSKDTWDCPFMKVMVNLSTSIQAPYNRHRQEESENKIPYSLLCAYSGKSAILPHWLRTINGHHMYSYFITCLLFTYYCYLLPGIICGVGFLVTWNLWYMVPSVMGILCYGNPCGGNPLLWDNLVLASYSYPT